MTFQRLCNLSRYKHTHEVKRPFFYFTTEFIKIFRNGSLPIQKGPPQQISENFPCFVKTLKQLRIALLSPTALK